MIRILHKLPGCSVLGIRSFAGIPFNSKTSIPTLRKVCAPFISFAQTGYTAQRAANWQPLTKHALEVMAQDLKVREQV